MHEYWVVQYQVDVDFQLKPQIRIIRSLDQTQFLLFKKELESKLVYNPVKFSLH